MSVFPTSQEHQFVTSKTMKIGYLLGKIKFLSTKCNLNNVSNTGRTKIPKRYQKRFHQSNN